MRALFTVIVIAAVELFSLGCSRSKEGENYTHVASEDAAMNAAIAKAKATADEFVRAIHARRPDTKNFFVKKAYQTPSGGFEHMWIEVFAEKQGVLEGRVANEAEETQEIQIGQRVSVKVSEISDWKYQDGNKLIGGFTIRYFVEKMSPRERETFLKTAGFEL